MVPSSVLRAPCPSGRARRVVLVRSMAATFTALAMLVATLRAVSIYYYCAAMEASFASACCAPAPAPDDVPRIFAADCCERRAIDGLPSVQLGEGQAVPSAPLSFVLPVPMPAPGAWLLLAVIHRTRWGSDPPLFESRARARSMVFLI